MAVLYRTTGFQEEVHPADGKAFSLRELQTLVGGYIEVVPTTDGRLMVVDEEGSLRGKAVNHVATTHYLYRGHDVITGECLVATAEELGEDGREEEELEELDEE